MWTEEQLTEDLREIGLREGAAVLVHTSLRAVGKIEGGAETLVKAFRNVLGSEGALMAPTFSFDHTDPSGWQNPPESREELEQLRALLPVFDLQTTPADIDSMGIFPEIVRQQPDAVRSEHPAISFAAIGAKAQFLIHNAPFHYPLGTDSPLAHLHQIDGYVLLIGTGHTANSSLHLAEVWAKAPYINRTALLKIGQGRWAEMKGSPECSAGFGKIEPLLRNSRVLREGYIGNAASQLMRQRALVSMAVAMLHGDAKALLCDAPDCRWCNTARRFCAEPIKE